MTLAFIVTKNRMKLALAAGILSLLTASVARAETPSVALLNSLRPQGYVSDFAGILQAGELFDLEDKAVELNRKTGAQLAIVTVSSLEGGQIDDFAFKLFNSPNWRIGEKGKNNGVLLLVAMQDRKFRIEVGYGLEQILPNALAGRILDEQLRPAFRQGRFGQGLADAMSRISAIVERGEPASRQDRQAVKPHDQRFAIFVALASITISLVIVGTCMGWRQFWLSLVAISVGLDDGRRHRSRRRSRFTGGFVRGGFGAGGFGAGGFGGGGFGGGGFGGGGGGGFGGFGGGCSGGGGASGGW